MINHVLYTFNYLKKKYKLNCEHIIIWTSLTIVVTHYQTLSVSRPRSRNSASLTLGTGPGPGNLIYHPLTYGMFWLKTSFYGRGF